MTRFSESLSSLRFQDPSFEALFIGAIDAMVILDNAARCVDANLAACVLFGVSWQELLRHTVNDFLVSDSLVSDSLVSNSPGSDSLAPETRLAWQPFRPGERSAGTLRFRKADGSVSDVEFAVTANIAPERHLAIFRPDRDRPDRLAQLPAADPFSQVFRASPDAIAIVTFAEGRYVEANDSFFSLFGFSREELIGHTATELGIWANPDDRAYRQQLEAEGVIRSGEFHCRTQSGEERQLLGSAELIALNGEVCVLTIFKDITERKQAELAMQQAMEREQQTIHQERFIAAIAQNIRQSLDLDYILTTTVEEVQQFLQVDRVLLVHLNPDGSGTVIAEALDEEVPSILNAVLSDPGCGDAMRSRYLQGHSCAINDIHSSDLAIADIQQLDSLNVQSVLTVPILIRQSLWGLLVAHQCSAPRRWQSANWQALQQLSTQLAIGIHQAMLYQQTQQHAQKESLLNQVIQSIRTSLDLNTIFAAATSEIGRRLQVDRAEIVQYMPERQLWLNVASYRNSDDLPNALGLEIPDENNEFATRLKQRQTVRSNGAIAELDAINQQFDRIYPGAWLLVPLQMGSTIWGSLSLNHLNRSWHWHDWEVELAQAIADQLAIAIQQCELFRQVQQLNLRLEDQVQERTAQLRQALEFEATLKRITDRVRDSLDEDQILQTAVRELARAIGVDLCDAAIYDPSRGTSTIHYEYSTEEAPVYQGLVVPMFSFPECYHQLLQGECFQFCYLEPDRVGERSTALSCPIQDDQDVLGDLWLLKPAADWFSDAEIRLVQQVANQCAIALRQSRLFQAAQAQVEELERLNHLKDDFLSTVSHELRTPMSNIKLATQMLEIRLRQLGLMDGEPTTFGRYFAILQEECERETHLINDLLELTRLDAGTEPLLTIAVNLTILIPHVAEPFLDRLSAQQLQLAIVMPDSLPLLVTDLSYLERVLAELLNNACKYTPPGETVTIAAQMISLADERSAVQLRVTNSGVEIPEAERDRVFDKFYRIPSSDPWRYGGTGLGLALVKKLVERLGASIWVESGAGQTSFVLQFSLR